jgi:hypothetical protein
MLKAHQVVMNIRNGHEQSQGLITITVTMGCLRVLPTVGCPVFQLTSAQQSFMSAGNVPKAVFLQL